MLGEGRQVGPENQKMPKWEEWRTFKTAVMQTVKTALGSGGGWALRLCPPPDSRPQVPSRVPNVRPQWEVSRL